MELEKFSKAIEYQFRIYEKDPNAFEKLQYATERTDTFLTNAREAAEAEDCGDASIVVALLNYGAAVASARATPRALVFSLLDLNTEAELKAACLAVAGTITVEKELFRTQKHASDLVFQKGASLEHRLSP